MPSSIALEYPSFKRLSAHLSSNSSKTSILSGHKQQVYNIGWSSDGKRLASTAAEASGGLRIWSMGKSVSRSPRRKNGALLNPSGIFISKSCTLLSTITFNPTLYSPIYPNILAIVF
jgi:WD40 repeat protein